MAIRLTVMRIEAALGKDRPWVSPKSRFGTVQPQEFSQMAMQKAVGVKVPKGGPFDRASNQVSCYSGEGLIQAFFRDFTRTIFAR